MKTIKTLTLSTLALLPLISTSAFAQTTKRVGQKICFSFDGAGKLTGKNNTGRASKTGVRVGGKSFFVGGAGKSTSDCASTLVSQLTAAGYTASKSAANVVCVTRGKNGAPLTTGGIIGTDDTGLKGIDCSVKPQAPKPNQKPAKKPLKKQGVKIPQVRPRVVVAINQTITIEVEIEKVVNGKKVTIQIKIQIKLFARMTSQQANRAIFDALCMANLCPTQVVVSSPFLNMPVPSFGLEYDSFGNPVRHVTLWQPLQLDLFPLEISAGDVPLFGGTSFGHPSGIFPPGLFLGIDGFPGIGQPFQPFVQNGFPSGHWLPAIGLREFELPLLGGDLLIDPSNMLLLPLLPLNALGAGSLQLPIPPVPSLIGQSLVMQALVMDSTKSQLGFTNGLRTTIGN